MKRSLTLVLIWSGTLLISAPPTAAAAPTDGKSEPGEPCREQQTARSKELQELANQDQLGRENLHKLAPEERRHAVELDGQRRARVATIFAEGCLRSAADYAAAALVFQHGQVADHFFQAFLWARRAVELGDKTQQELVARGLDRFLVNSKKNQLYATQAGRYPSDKGCYCLEPVEHSFPDSLRKESGGRTLEDATAWLGEINKGLGCGPLAECQGLKRAATPKGSIPGVW